MRRSGLVAILAAPAAAASSDSVPEVWRDADIAGYRTPLAGLGRPPVLVSERDYYALPEVNLKTYPVYTPDKEPPGYLEWLKRQDPQPLVDAAKLKTDADWIAARRGGVLRAGAAAVLRQRG